MPTSSQALILKKGVLTEDEVRPTSSGHLAGISVICADRCEVIMKEILMMMRIMMEIVLR
ncbi:hypothetical protein DPMN_002084 [Dreissena polymorpha]|uniref:Uncharacterized protein n=1 Tax=Dreissena polymorpha TaxID=45954 RepID=A0A9D4MKL0_DREPO|nr:hypothetical protein DPMN_002084 [Dreissena polymorpha]